MDKVGALTHIAKNITTEGFSAIGAGISANKQIQNNKNNARTKKGWDTRRNNSLVKKADEDKVLDARMIARSLANNARNPAHAVAEYAKRSLVLKARSILTPGMPKDIA